MVVSKAKSGDAVKGTETHSACFIYYVAGNNYNIKRNLLNNTERQLLSYINITVKLWKVRVKRDEGRTHSKCRF